MSCQSSLCLHEVMDTHWECLVNRLFISMASRVLIVDVFVNRLFVSMVSWMYPFGVSCQLYICLHGINGTQWECLVNHLFTSMISHLLIEIVENGAISMGIHNTGLQIRVRTRKLFFLFLNQNICCGYSEETVSLRRFFWAHKTYV